MDSTVYKIALAGLMHDIGKFAQRARFDVSRDFLDRNAGLYQPYIEKEKRHTHVHAVYTAAFVDYFDKYLPPQLNRANWGEGDTFVNLAAGHHKPETPLQWIIAMADWISSGADRQSFEGDNKPIAISKFRETRLLTIFEQVSIKGDAEAQLKFRYALKPLSPASIFPTGIAEPQEDAGEEYRELLLAFSDALSLIAHRNDSMPLWYEHFDSLLCEFTSSIPAATVGDVVHDVSLYDHSRATAALAAALYLYHTDTDTMNISAIKEDWQTQKFLLVSADFYGIQDFIFSEGGETAKGRAKMLRGRSFMVSLFSELAAHALCNALRLPPSSVLLSAAGKFTIVCQNTPASREAVLRVSDEINTWLIDRFFGENSIGISTVEASANDFVGGHFADLWEKLTSAVDRRKYSRTELLSRCGAVEGYLDSFDNTLNPPICPFCGKRASVAGAMATLFGESVKDSCLTCRDQILLGTEIVKNDKIAITTADAVFHGERKLLDPIFGRYQIGFAEGRLSEFARQGTLIKFWQIRASSNVEKDRVTVRHIGGYVPVYDVSDFSDTRIISSRRSEGRSEELLDQMVLGVPKTFHHLAAKSRLGADSIDGSSRGVAAIGTFKADVDNLGLVLATGLPRTRMTLSRFATVSRQINAFFSLYVPSKLADSPDFRDIYTVFAGGDDLFLIGPWNRMLDFAIEVNADFRKYTCRNGDITLSAGFSLHKPGEPLRRLSELTDAALSDSKNAGKDRMTLFGQTVEWTELADLSAVRNILEEWIAEGLINNGMLHRLNAYQFMAEKERTVRDKKGGVFIEDIADCLWRPMFRYSMARNIKKKRDDVMKVAAWIDRFAGRFRIPLWRVIYEHRKE